MQFSAVTALAALLELAPTVDERDVSFVPHTLEAPHLCHPQCHFQSTGAWFVCCSSGNVHRCDSHCSHMTIIDQGNAICAVTGQIKAAFNLTPQVRRLPQNTSTPITPQAPRLDSVPGQQNTLPFPPLLTLVDPPVTPPNTPLAPLPLPPVPTWRDVLQLCRLASSAHESQHKQSTKKHHPQARVTCIRKRDEQQRAPQPPWQQPLSDQRSGSSQIRAQTNRGEHRNRNTNRNTKKKKKKRKGRGRGKKQAQKRGQLCRSEGGAQNTSATHPAPSPTSCFNGTASQRRQVPEWPATRSEQVVAAWARKQIPPLAHGTTAFVAFSMRVLHTLIPQVSQSRGQATCIQPSRSCALRGSNQQDEIADSSNDFMMIITRIHEQAQVATELCAHTWIYMQRTGAVTSNGRFCYDYFYHTIAMFWKMKQGYTNKRRDVIIPQLPLMLYLPATDKIERLEWPALMARCVTRKGVNAACAWLETNMSTLPLQNYSTQRAS